jgi:hypothetical protein
MRYTIRHGVLAATGVAVAIGVAGCSDDTPGQAQNPPLPTFSSASVPTAVPTGTAAPTVPPPTGESASAVPPPASDPPEPGLTGECKAPELKLSIGRGEGAAGTVYRPLRFTNVGSRTCPLQGFPGVSYVTGDDGHQVGPAAFREGTKGAAVTLAPGETGFVTVGFIQVGNFDPAVCKPTAVRGLRVYPPHETASLFLPLDGTGCAGNPPEPQLKVRTMQKGNGGD